MNAFTRRLLICLRLCLTPLLFSPYAWAALGATSTATVARQSQSVTERRFIIHEIREESARIREYALPDGTVFGVAWNGVAPPDLQSLLGDHAGEYQEALKDSPRVPGQRHHSVDNGNIVVEHWGHMRNIQGRAFLPSLVPTGVSSDEIR